MTIATQAAGRQWTVASETQPGVLYIVKRYRGQTTCDCPSGFYRGACKHVVAIDAQYPELVASKLSPEARSWGLSALTGGRQS